MEELCQEHDARALELGVERDCLTSLEPPRVPPVEGEGVVRVLQWNILAWCLSNDGFVVEHVLPGAAPPLAETISRIVEARESGDEDALRRIKDECASEEAVANHRALVDWQRRWARMRALIAAAAPHIITLQELDKMTDVQVQLEAMGYACGPPGARYSAVHSNGKDVAPFPPYLAELEERGVAFVPSRPSTGRRLGIKANIPDADDDGVAVFWREDLLELIRVDFVPLQDARKYKAAPRVDLRRRSDGVELTVFSAHLTSGKSPKDDAAREAEICGKTLDRNGDETGPSLCERFHARSREVATIFCLDANSTPDRLAESPGEITPWRALRSAQGTSSVWDGFFGEDGKPRAGAPMPFTTNKMRGPLSDQPSKIGDHAIGVEDHIFLGGPATLQRHAWGPMTATSVAEARLGMLPTLAVPSDHAPVLVDVVVKRLSSSSAEAAQPKVAAAAAGPEAAGPAVDRGSTRCVVIRDKTSVFESPESWKRWGRLLNKGDIVYAVGAATRVGLHTMQTISPKGAIEAKFLRPEAEAETRTARGRPAGRPGAAARGASRGAAPEANAGIRFATPGSGLTTAYLAGAKADVPVVPWVADHSEPAVLGTIDKFREDVADSPLTLSRLRNKVRICAHCKKPCAITVRYCNGCGDSLDGIPVSYNDNVFMGFVYGIEKGKFPYKISLRYQDECFLCFDDPLSLSPLHLNCIPTDLYVADMRFLFLNPEKGLELINRMFEVAAKVAIEQFWKNDDFRNKVLNGEKIPDSPADIINSACCGLNYPPSMYQLHLQFIHMPMTPFQYCQAKRDGHWHYGRFFPLEYVRSALALGDKVKMEVTENTDIQDIIQKVHQNGVVYDSKHREFLHKCWNLQEDRFATWEEGDFECQVVNGRVYNMADGRMDPDSDPKALQAADTKRLQNYGRPYTENGQTTGTYYKYAKAITEVLDYA